MDTRRRAGRGGPPAPWTGAAVQHQHRRAFAGQRQQLAVLAVASILCLGVTFIAAAGLPNPSLPQNLSAGRATASRSLLQGLDCDALLARTTVAVFPGPERPDLSDVSTLMPSHTVDISEAAVAYLPLVDPEAAACAQRITTIQDTLLVYDDGTLSTHKASLPTGLQSTSGQLILKGKDGSAANALSDLTFLSSLKEIGGLSVYNMDQLTSFKGLEQLTTITGDLIISLNNQLVNLTGLDALTTIKRSLLLNSNMNLQTLDGLENLESIGGDLLLKGNGYLMDTDAFTSLQTIGGTSTLINNGNALMRLPEGVGVGPGAVSTRGEKNAQPGGSDGALIVIYGGPTPPTISDLSFACQRFMPPLSKFDINVQRTSFHSADQPLTTAPGGLIKSNVVVYDNGQLPWLGTSMKSVTAIAGSLVIVGGFAMGGTPDSPGIASLDGLQALRSVGELGMVGATQLVDLNGLQGLAAIRGSLVVNFCPRITSLKGLGATSATATSDASNTASLRGLRQLTPALPSKQRRRSSRSDVLDLSLGLQKIGSQMWIQNNQRLTSLAGLEVIREISWHVNIRACPELTALDALSSLQRIGGQLIITDNPALVSTAGLSSLQEIGRGVSLLWNTLLADIQGLARITVIPGDLVLSGNEVLASLSPLSGLTAVGLNLAISRTAVTDLSGLEKLTQVGGGLAIIHNPKLSSFNGLSSLAVVGDDVSIRDNSQLSSIDSLASSLQTVGGGLYIEDNPSLSSLSAMPQRLAGVGEFVLIRKNGNVPADQTEKLAAKSRQAGGVPDTVDLLPQINALAAALPSVGNATTAVPSILTTWSMAAFGS